MKLPASGLSKREVARRMARKHPHGVTPDTIETGRRTINKVLAGDLSPRDPMRASIAEALGEKKFPSVDDEEEDLEATLAALVRERPQLAREIARMVRR